MSSLPVPVSPKISTVDSVGATTSTCFSTALRAALVPTISSKLCVPVSSFGCRALRSRAIACWIARSRSSRLTGLVRNSSAPAFMARTDVGISPWPVIKIIGILTPALASSCCKSRPLRPGNCTSSTRQPGAFGRSAAKNSCADENVCALNPAERMTFLRLSRVYLSSSTMNTNAFFSSMIKPPGRFRHLVDPKKKFNEPYD